MKTAKPNTANSPRPLFFAILLFVILAALFCKSFLPGYIQFSNDGPLGQQSAAAARLPDAFTGSWGDLNIIGASTGAASFGLSSIINWGFQSTSGSVGMTKFYAPIALFILGLGAWTFFRQMRVSPLAAVLGGIAATLNASFFSRACWGIGAHPVAIGMDFLALALIVSNTPLTPAPTRWVRLVLAGLAVGMGVIEGADVGAILSLFIAAFVFYKALNEEGVPLPQKIGGGILRVAVVAGFAGFMALQTIVALVGSQVSGIAGTSQDSETKAHQWDFATQWSLPKKETLGFLVPGLFGYRMDTPKDMAQSLQDAYQGGEYWGGAGRTPQIDRYFDNGSQGAQPPGIMRFNGDGNYLGILVALLATFAIVQSLRRENSPFTAMQKKFVWFWAGAMVIGLLLAWGRFAPFYQFFYALPYVSTIRNPVKFIFVFSWAVVILSGFGAHVLSRRYLEVPATNPATRSGPQLKSFERNWIVACAIAVGVSALAWLMYSAEKSSLIHYLQMVGFSDQGTAKEIAAFSIGQAGWFVLIFAVAAGLFALVIAGKFSGKRAKLGGVLLGALLVLDLGRADLPFIIHWDYVQKYASNPIIDLLRDKPYEHRVAIVPPWFPYLPEISPQVRQAEQLLDELNRIEWMQHHFPYYNIQSLDIVQMPRTGSDWAAFDGALKPVLMQDSVGHVLITPATVHLIERLWELTDTRYILGAAGFLDVLNNEFDPVQHRFRIVQRFSIGLKPGVTEFHQRLEELTAIPGDTGDYALFEFTGALPRAKLYSNWQVSTNDEATLKTLADKNFDPLQTVLVATAVPATPTTNANPGTVEFKSYSPKDIMFTAQADAASVMLLNDKFDPHWSVTVDGKPAELLRCNFIMRGVYLTPGAHTVEFQFTLPHRPLYVTLAAIGVGLVLLGVLKFLTRRDAAQSPVG